MNRDKHDDIEDFMAKLLGGQSTQKEIPTNRFSRPKKQLAPTVDGQTAHNPSRKPTYRLKKRFVLIAVTPLVIVTVGFVSFLLWNGPISSLIMPPSPFSDSQKQKMGIPLYYPTKLPGTFKIETNSITQPDSGVILYAITDDQGKRINVTLQKQPEGVNLDPLYAALKDVKELQTKFGKVKYGTSGEGITVVNILTGSTWVIINSPQGILKEADISLIVGNLAN